MYVYIHLSHTWTNPDDPRTLSFYVQEIFKDEILWCGSLRSDLETGTLNTIYLSATSVSWSWSWLVRVTTLFQMEAYTIWVNLFSTSQNIDGWFFQQGWFRLVNYYPARFPGRSRIPEHPIGEFASIKPDSWGDYASLGHDWFPEWNNWNQPSYTSPTPLHAVRHAFFQAPWWNRRCQSVMPAPLCLENWPGEISVAVGLWPVDCLF